MKNKAMLGNFLLILTALIWGCAFVAQSVGMEYVEPITFNGIRCIIGGIVLIIANAVFDSVKKKNGTYRKAAKEEKKAYLATIKGVSLGSDAFFPFGDNIERAAKSGVTYIAEPGGSIRDDNVIDVCNKYKMVMAFTKMRLFHH